MQMFPDDLPLANIDADGYCCHSMRSSVRPTIHGLGFVYCIQSAWKKWPTIWHADVSRWLTLSIHGFMDIVVGLYVRPSVRLFVYGIFRWLCICWQITWNKWHEICHADVSPSLISLSQHWCLTIWFFFFFLLFFLRLGLGQRRAVVIIGRWLLPSLVDTVDISCHYWQHILVRKMQSWWELIIIKMSCQSFISTWYHTTSCTLPLPSFQELNSNPRLFTISQYLFCIKISQIHVYPKHFCHRKLMFWSFTRPFLIPCSTWYQIHHMSSKWNKMCQPQKKQKQHSNNTMISQN